MKTSPSSSPRKSASQEIDAIIKKSDDWRGKRLSQLRILIKKADTDIIEEVKWKKPSNPMGVPVWSHNGIVCVGDALKKAVRLTFPKGAQMKDPKKLFNTRLESNTVRAIDFHEDDSINVTALKALILEAVKQNPLKKPLKVRICLDLAPGTRLFGVLIISQMLVANDYQFIRY